MRNVILVATAMVAVIALRASTMEAAVKTVMMNTCNGPVAVNIDDGSCSGPVALPVAASCSGREGLFAGVARRVEARQTGRQAKRATKNAVKANLRSCAVPVALPLTTTYAAVPVTSYVPVTTYQPVTTYKAVPVATPLKAPCKEPCATPQPPQPQPNGDPPLSAVPSDHLKLTSR